MRVYAIKLLIMGITNDNVFAHVGYLELDLYGKTDNIQPNLPAIEEFSVPQLKELANENTPKEQTTILDDDFDDKLEEYKCISHVKLSPTSAALVGVVDNVNRMASSFDRLNSVAQSLDKIAKCTLQVAELFSH